MREATREPQVIESRTTAPRRPERNHDGGLAKKVTSWLFVRYPMLLVLIGLMLVSNSLYPGFFEMVNLRNMAIQNAAIALVALGMTLVMIGGGFDLSVGAVFALGTVLFAKFADAVPLPAAGLIALGGGALCGLVNGLVITRLKVNPFVATLGLGSVFSGVAYWITHGQSLAPTNESFGWLADSMWFTFSAAAVLVALCYVLVSIVMNRTSYGRSIYAIGGNLEAARLAGLHVDRIRVSTYIIVGICAAAAGVITASRSFVGQAELGASVPLDAIAIVIVGGTSLFGGEGSVARTVIGLLVMATVANLFNRMAVSISPQLIAQGLIVVGAVALDLVTRRRQT